MDIGVVLGAAAWALGVVLIVVMALLPWLELQAGRAGGRGER
jgi:hypothetical protein